MKKVYLGLICSLLFAGVVSANTNVEVWVGGDTPTSGVHLDGGVFAPYFSGSLLAASIDGSMLIDGTVSNADIAANAIDGSKLVNGTVSNADIAASSIDGSKLVDGTISNADIAASAIDGSKLIDGTVSNVDIAANVAVGKLAVAQGKVIIGNGSGLGEAQTLSGITVSTSGVMTVGASQIDGSMLVDGTISNADVAASSIDGSKLIDGTVSNVDIGANADVAVSKIALAQGAIVIGNAGGDAEAQTISGVITLATNGVTAFQAGQILNADVAGTAGIILSKLEAVAPSNIIVGSQSTSLVSVAVSGDMRIATNGVTMLVAGNASNLNSGVLNKSYGGAGDVSGILKANGAGVVSAASAGTDYLAPATVWGYPAITSATNALVNTATITAKDTAGATLAGYRLFHVWLSLTDKGAASTNNIETLVLSTGTAISTVTANADYWYCSAAAGTAVATITATETGTNYLMAADGSSITSLKIVSVSP
jgi:hypothetical protein